jgi:transketolase
MRKSFKELESLSKQIRRCIIETIANAQKGHLGGALSSVDILTYLYFSGFLNHDSTNPNWKDRDRLFLSKGHAGTGLLSVLAKAGYFEESELLSTFNRDGSRFGNNPDESIPGIEIHTGSLGHGLSIGAGHALSTKLNKQDLKTVVLLSDGECHEGSIWEGAMFAGHHQLSNLLAIVDRNKQCCDEFTEKCLKLEPLADKFKSFNWSVYNANGHDFESLHETFIKINNDTSGLPKMIIAETVKGKGVSFMEGIVKWHHSVPNSEERELAINELS